MYFFILFIFKWQIGTVKRPGMNWKPEKFKVNWRKLIRNWWRWIRQVANYELFAFQWLLSTTSSGWRMACFGRLWKSTLSDPTWATRNASWQPSQRVTTGRQYSTKAFSCKFSAPAVRIWFSVLLSVFLTLCTLHGCLFVVTHWYMLPVIQSINF